MDGKRETAWNGRTGDLVGAWIGLRVPADAYVDCLEMNVGFDKAGKDGDLFTKNHRIKRVRVSREGVLVIEHTFDVAERGLQAIPIGKGGGRFRVEVLEVVPGTETKWRGCVSELRLIGTPGPTAFSSPTTPLVGVGMLPHDDPGFGAEPARQAAEAQLGRRYPDIAAFCRAWNAKIGPYLVERRKNGGSFRSPEPRVPDARFAVRGIRSDGGGDGSDEVWNVTSESWSEDRVVIETPAELTCRWPMRSIISRSTIRAASAATW